MLAALGMDSVDELFADIPERLRSSPLRLDPPEPEQQLMGRLAGLAARNRVDLASFLGAGAYRHFSPPLVDQILLRGEWYTAYTPYQPEVSQGTLQSIYEYESLIAELVGLDVVSASHYDGAAATAEAALMTCRATARGRVLVSRAVHPHYRQVLQTYVDGAGLDVDDIPIVADGPDGGTTDLGALKDLLADAEAPVAGVILAQPSFYGLLEPMAEASRLAHEAGALFVAVVEPVSLAVLAPPGAYGADIAAGEGQSLGIPPQYGGPYLGILACTDALVRQIPGRLVGMTSDVDGRRAYVMTLQAREQHIRREKAASNICTNQTLLALGAVRAAELEAALSAIGIARVHAGAYVNEFAIRVPNAAAVHRELLGRGVLAGLVVADAVPDEPTLGDALLVCATELTTSDEIAAFARELAGVLAGMAAGPDATRPPTSEPVGATR
jgi:glycine dehydrogenase subunit 1